MIGFEMTDLFPQAIAVDIAHERKRQELLREAGKFVATCATTGACEMSEYECLAVLGEEFGEVARALLDAPADEREVETRAHLRAELVQTAAVCVAWLARLDSRPRACDGYAG